MLVRLWSVLEDGAILRTADIERNRTGKRRSNLGIYKHEAFHPLGLLWLSSHHPVTVVLCFLYD